MTILFDLLVIAFLLSVGIICAHWGHIHLRLVKYGWYPKRWQQELMRLFAAWAVFLGLYNLTYALMKVWFTIEGYLV